MERRHRSPELGSARTSPSLADRAQRSQQLWRAQRAAHNCRCMPRRLVRAGTLTPRAASASGQLPEADAPWSRAHRSRSSPDRVENRPQALRLRTAMETRSFLGLMVESDAKHRVSNHGLRSATRRASSRMRSSRRRARLDELVGTHGIDLNEASMKYPATRPPFVHWSRPLLLMRLRFLELADGRDNRSASSSMNFWKTRSATGSAFTGRRLYVVANLDLDRRGQHLLRLAVLLSA